MNILSIRSVGGLIPFGYKSILKDMFRDGELPTVKKGLYGTPLTEKNISIEHMIPHSKGGKSSLSNYALADRFINSKRGSDDIRKYLTPEMAKEYFAQFQNLVVNYKNKIFNGNDYIKNCLKTLEKLGIKVDM